MDRSSCPAGIQWRRLELTDDECLRLGLPRGWRPEADQIARDRYGALAWMVAAGLLEVRVALPLDHAGRPCYPGRGGALYHPKAGILSNGDGNVIVFQGSVNETSAAWTRNREMFEVKRSWASEQPACLRGQRAESAAGPVAGDEAARTVPLPVAAHGHPHADGYSGDP